MEDKEYLSPAKEGFGGQDEQFYYGIGDTMRLLEN